MPNSREFLIAGATIAALEWHTDAPIKVIALHGWLDNAASFEKLAPLLPHAHIVALDAPGHGLSDYKPPQASYNLWDDIRDILAVADALGWESFHILGHSRGAMMSFLMGASCPDRLLSLSLLDGFWPMPEPIVDAPKILAKFIRQNHYQHDLAFPVYENFSALIEPRINGNLPMSAEAATVLMQRGAYQDENGCYHLRADPRLKTGSAFKLSEQHNEAFLAQQQVPALLVYATEGVGKYRNYFNAVETSDKVIIKELPGGHHFHLEEATAQIAEWVREHQLSNDKNS